MLGIDIFIGLSRGETSAYQEKIEKNIIVGKPNKVANYLAMYFSFHPWKKGEIKKLFPGAVRFLKSNGYRITIGELNDYDQIVITTPSEQKYYYSTFPNIDWVEELFTI